MKLYLQVILSNWSKSLVILLIFFVSCSNDNNIKKDNSKPLLIIDTDITMGLTNMDVDDGLAVGAIILSEKYNILGITTTYGNGQLKDVYGQALELLAHLNVSIPVYKGSQSKYFLGITNEASSFIVNSIMEHKNEVNLLLIGPLTNLATAFLINNDIVTYVKSVTIMGGAFAVKGNVFPEMHAEFNFFRDPEAAEIVFKNFQNIDIFPLDICMKTMIGEKEITELSQCDTDWCKYLYSSIKDWYDINYNLFGGFYPYDAVAAYYLVNKNGSFKSYSSPVSVVVDKESDYYGVSISNVTDRPLQNIFYDMDGEMFLNGLWKTLQISVK